MSIPIVFLVLATLVLTVFSLFVFSIRLSSLSKPLALASLDEIYAKEELINFYIDKIMEKSVKDFKLEYGEQGFIDNFKQELARYKQGNDFVLEGLGQVEGQLKDENIEIDEGNKKISLSLSMTVFGGSSYKNTELFSASYTYRKTFEKAL